MTSHLYQLVLSATLLNGPIAAGLVIYQVEWCQHQLALSPNLWFGVSISWSCLLPQGGAIISWSCLLPSWVVPLPLGVALVSAVSCLLPRGVALVPAGPLSCLGGLAPESAGPVSYLVGYRHYQLVLSPTKLSGDSILWLSPTLWDGARISWSSLLSSWVVTVSSGCLLPCGMAPESASPVWEFMGLRQYQQVLSPTSWGGACISWSCLTPLGVSLVSNNSVN